METEFDKFKDEYFLANKEDKFRMIFLNVSQLQKFDLNQIISLFNLECDQYHEFNFNYLINIADYTVHDYIYMIKILKSNLRMKFMEYLIGSKTICFSIDQLGDILECFDSEKLMILYILDSKIRSFKTIDKMNVILKHFSEDKDKIKVMMALIKTYDGDRSTDDVIYVLSQCNSDAGKYLLIKKFLKYFNKVNYNQDTLKRVVEDQIKDKNILSKCLDILHLKNHLKVFHSKFHYDLHFFRKKDSISFYQDNIVTKITKKSKSKIKVVLLDRKTFKQLGDSKYYSNDIVVSSDEIFEKI
ncbi:hypothetical protein Catovirus_1_843 [Catovirus CTV1]|uniref:Uncharacterized protein n=1 Tax=Catovirus CTV1 TaxID=1977631 RepID=A0A1V0SAS0_9VIRU|nr:hypothetical protein Catovirus_1_843 [Catovirus CTV1]